MSLKLNVLKCPNCGANLQVEEGRKKLFCSYCGAPIEVTNENEYIIHNIDENEAKKIDYEKMIELKKLEMQEAELKRKHEYKHFIIGMAILLGLFVFVVIITMLAVFVFGE